MKKILIFLSVIVILLASCVQKELVSKQTINDIIKQNTSILKSELKTNTELSSKNISQNKTTVNITDLPKTEKSIIKIDVSEKNISLSKTSIAEKWIQGKTYLIELIDVTSDGRGCMIGVDGEISLIDEGESATLNGLKIYVLEAYPIKSFSGDDDVCKIIIS